MQKTKRKQLKTYYTMKTKLFLLAMVTIALAVPMTWNEGAPTLLKEDSRPPFLPIRSMVGHV